MLWVVDGPNSGFLGVGADIRSNCLRIADPSNQFMNNEIWIIQGSGDYNTQRWVEAGVTVGKNFQTSMTYTSPRNFWALNNTSTGYTERTSAAGYTLGTYNTVRIAGDGNDNWRVTSSAGMNANFSGAGMGVTNKIQGGLESADSNGQSYGSLSNMQYLSLTNQWVTGWSNASSYAQPGYNQQLSATWAQTYHWMRDQQGAVC